MAQQDNTHQILPDEKYYRFLKTIEIAGFFAVPDRDQIFAALKPNMQIRLIREPDNLQDKNAIRAYDLFSHRVIGYIPRADAACWALDMDSGNCYTGWIKSTERNGQKIFVDIYERVKIPCTGISSITFEESGFFSPSLFCKFTFRDKKLLCRKTTEPFGVCSQLELKFTDEHWQNFILPAVQKSNFLAWQPEYTDAAVLDGIQWKMTIRMGRNGIRNIYGSNDFPEEWDIFRNFIDDCLHLDNLKGNGTISVLK